MSDTVDKHKRSLIMKAVGVKNTNSEMIVRKFLFQKGLRFRLHNKKISGTPDITLAKYKTIIFVNGCFWHSHENCKKASVPKSNSAFWKSKLERNKERDSTNISTLEKQGWNVLVVWGCELSKRNRLLTLQKLVSNIFRNINS